MLQRFTLAATFFFLVLINSISQPYQPFPSTDGNWKVRYSDAWCLDYHMTNATCSEYQYILTGDTSINGMTYHKFTCSGRNRNPDDETWTYWDQGYYGCYRNYEPGQKVYFIPKDSLNEVLLYDFDLELNDTLPDSYIYHPEPGNIITVDQIDSLLAGDTYLKRYHLDNAGFGGDYLIEGIGCTMGLLTYIHPYFEDYYELLCFKNDEDGLYYYEYDTTECDLITAVPDHTVAGPLIIIYPNPARDHVTIAFPEYTPGKRAFFRIYSPDGRMIRNCMIDARENQIDLTGLNKGIYFINIYNEDRFFISTIMKN